MFGLAQLPRTMSAAQRDATHSRRHVRLSVINDLVRLSRPGQPDRETGLRVLSTLLAGDADAEVRARAAIAFADCEAGPEVVPALLTAARGEHVGVAEMALAALREIAPPEEPRVSSLVKVLARGEHPALRFQAVGAAARVLDEVAFIDLLTQLLRDPDVKVRGHALRVADERFGGGRIPPSVVRAAEAAVGDSEPWVRLAAALLLAPHGHGPAHEVLVSALNQRWPLPAPEDEQALIELVGELGLTQALPGLRRHARGWFGLVPGRFAWHSQVAMARLGEQAARKAIAAGLRHRHSHVRAASALAVGRARLHELRGEVEQLVERGKLDPALAEEVLEELTHP
jgi:HEAT repeat protein